MRSLTMLMTAARRWWPAALAVAAAGCASEPGPFARWQDLEPPRHSTTPPPRAAATVPGEAAAGTEPLAIPADADVEDYVELALARAPSLRAARYRVARLAARVPQVTSLDDPMLEVAPVGDMAETAAGQVGLMAGVSQRLPWPATLEARGRVAQQDVAVAAAEFERERLAVAADARRAFWQLYAATRSIEETQAARPLIEQVRDLALAQLRAGTAGQADVLRANVELAELDRRLADLRQRRDTAAAMLNRLLDRGATAPIPDPPAVDPYRVELAQAALLTRAAEANPALQRVREQVQGYREQVRLARLNRVPALNVSLNYNVVDDEGLAMSATGDDQWWLGFGVNLPIWSAKYDAAVREARAGVLESLAELNAEQRRVAFDVQAAAFDVTSRQEQAQLFREQILPQAEQALEAARAGYRGGRGGFLDVLEAWQRLLALRLMYQQNLADLGGALADLRQAVGGELPEERSITQPAATQPEVQP